jgi:hypothetical protein
LCIPADTPASTYFGVDASALAKILAVVGGAGFSLT